MSEARGAELCVANCESGRDEIWRASPRAAENQHLVLEEEILSDLWVPNIHLPWEGSNDGVPGRQETRLHGSVRLIALADRPAHPCPMTDAFATDGSNPDKTIEVA
jgi:hypothetical protein